MIGEPDSPPLKDNYLSATIQPSIVSPVGEVTIQGSAKGNPAKGVAIWVIGDNNVNYNVIPVNSDSSFVYNVPTSNLANGDYSVVVQHPMFNTDFDIYPNTDKTLVLGSYPISGSTLFNLHELNSVSHSLAVDALVSNLNNPNTDDIFIQSKFSVGSESSPFVEEDHLSVSVQPSTINQGDTIRITGNAKANPAQGVAIWIFGKNYASHDTVSVNGDSTFEYDITNDITQNLASGEYTVIVQHPMYNDLLDVYVGANDVGYVLGPYPVSNSNLFKLFGSGSLQTQLGLNALLNELNDPNIDDQYEQLKFVVGTIPTTINPRVNSFIVNPRSGPLGQKFTISGTVSTGEGATLTQIELWRNDVDPSNQNEWHSIQTHILSGGLTESPYSFEDTLTNLGNYWYGIQVTDTSTWAHEGGGQDPVDRKPMKVVVTNATNILIGKSAPKYQENNTIMNYTLSYRNHGSNPAENVILKDILPAQVEYLSGSGNPLFNNNEGTITWNLGMIPPHTSGTQSVEVRIPASIPIGSLLNNTASITTTTKETSVQ